MATLATPDSVFHGDWLVPVTQPDCGDAVDGIAGRFTSSVHRYRHGLTSPAFAEARGALCSTGALGPGGHIASRVDTISQMAVYAGYP